MRRLLVLLAAAALFVTACSSGSGGDGGGVSAGNGGTRTSRHTAVAGTGAPTSVVQLGDSIASGEGTLYGYTYDQQSQEWTGGNIDAPWPPPYPLCHDSQYAYGNAVASYFGATFHQFACTGAQFGNGISTSQTSGSTTYRPAQFGNWTNQTNLNAQYDAAKPDLVLVTFGADDLQFVPIVEACIKNGYEYYFDLAKLECTAKNPGSTIQTDYFDFLPTLKQNYATIVNWIEARAKANNVAVPKIVFTNYADPLPPNGQKCPDTSWLYPKQTMYLSNLVTQLDQLIAQTIGGLNDPNVTVADISQAYSPQGVSHIWCTDAPWAYGLSIYHIYDPDSFDSQAPFHPTPDGQNSIATHVIAAAHASSSAPRRSPPSASARPRPPVTDAASRDTTYRGARVRACPGRAGTRPRRPRTRRAGARADPLWSAHHRARGGAPRADRDRVRAGRRRGPRDLVGRARHALDAGRPVAGVARRRAGDMGRGRAAQLARALLRHHRRVEGRRGCPADPGRPPGVERERLLDVAGAVLVVGDHADSAVPAVTVDQLAESIDVPTSPLPDVIADPAAAIASSGSTGRPKVIVTPGPGVYLEGVGKPMPSAYVELPEELPQLIPAPLYHTNGFGIAHSSLRTDDFIVVMEKFDARHAFELIERWRVTCFAAVPTMLARMAHVDDAERYDLSSLVYVMQGGATVPDWVVEKWIELIGEERFYMSYGSSERVGLSLIRADEWRAHRGSVGNGHETLIRVLDTDGRDLPPGEIGEIYMHRPLDLIPAFAYIGADPPPTTPDGYTSIGDLGWLDEDGYLYIADRRTDMIVTGGANVFPAEVESALSEHPGVHDVVVIGLPDPEWGHRVHAIVEATVTDAPPRSTTSTRSCAPRIAAYKVPKSYEIVDRIPRTEAGKVNRTALAAEPRARRLICITAGVPIALRSSRRGGVHRAVGGCRSRWGRRGRGARCGPTRSPPDGHSRVPSSGHRRARGMPRPPARCVPPPRAAGRSASPA